jgi:hypothetical protein
MQLLAPRATPARSSPSTAMTYIDPTSLLPQYETDCGSNQLRAYWPGLVAVARTKQAAKHNVFHELTRLPGGFFLAGVGETNHLSPIREEVLAHVSAGADLKEAMRTALGSDSSCVVGPSACYAHFDPLEATLRIEGVGQHVSAIHLTAGSGLLLRPQTESPNGRPITIALRPGEALALIAHPRSWDKHVLSAIHRALPDDSIILSEGEIQGLCAELDALPDPVSRLLLYRQDGAGAPKSGGSEDSLMPAGDTDRFWTPEDQELLNRMACSVV